jgi:recombinational DNA repair protein RecR
MKMEDVFEITNILGITYKISLCDICSNVEDENSIDCEECTKESVNYDINIVINILEKEIF